MIPGGREPRQSPAARNLLRAGSAGGDQPRTEKRFRREVASLHGAIGRPLSATTTAGTNQQPVGVGDVGLVHDADRPADVRLVLLARVHADNVADGGESVRDGNGTVLDGSAVRVRPADGLAAADDAPGVWVVAAAGPAVDARGAAVVVGGSEAIREMGYDEQARGGDAIAAKGGAAVRSGIRQAKIASITRP